MINKLYKKTWFKILSWLFIWIFTILLWGLGTFLCEHLFEIKSVSYIMTFGLVWGNIIYAPFTYLIYKNV